MNTASLPERDTSVQSPSRPPDCLDVIAAFDGVQPPHLDKLVPLHQVREWFCEAFNYSKSTFKRTHQQELDKNYFRAYFGVRMRSDGSSSIRRARPSSDRFYKSRVVWWLIERKKAPHPRHKEQPAARPDPADYA